MTTIKPNLTASEALRIAQRIHAKLKIMDYDRALEREDSVSITSAALDELVRGLEKIEERLQWSV